jgi:hypothetical protein
MTKIYLKGSAQKKTFEGGGEVINITIAKEDFDRIPERASKAGKVYKKISVSSRKGGADEFGNTHSVYIESDEDGVATESKKDGFTVGKPAAGDDLPF